MYATILILVLVFAGCAVGSLLTYIYFAKSSNNIKKEAEEIKIAAQKDVERLKKENILELKEEAHRFKIETDKQIKERKVEILDLDDKLTLRENGINKREELLFSREKMIEQKDQEIKKNYEILKEKEIMTDQALAKQEKILEEISQLTVQEAREIIMEETKNQMSKEIMTFIRQQEEEALEISKKRSQEIILSSMERYAATVTNEATISVVTLPDDEIKGRIIGREGRNIKAIELLTGVDLIIDDTPEAVVLSCFDPFRREIARLTLEKLIVDGRIHPGKIEECYLKSKNEIDERIVEYGEEAVFDLGLGRVPLELIKILGRLHFRTSYGQNVLKHSKEVAFLSGLIAAELGLDVKLARRAGLFHDIGKAVDHELEGSHVDLGIDIARKYKENETVINAIASHHGNTAPTSSISVIVGICDTLSAARPGARSESIENYIQRIRDLETICKNFKGIENAFAIQAGREVRVIVNPSFHDDLTAHQVARDIKDKIENELKYPGIIKVNVIRETRFVEEAK